MSHFTLDRDIGGTLGHGERDSYVKDNCCDCPPRGTPPSQVWVCEDGKKRCVNHYAKLRWQRRHDIPRFTESVQLELGV